MKRSEMIAAMEERGTVWDVIIIGGGASGLGAAVEAASRGHRTVLVEADDFAKGTSSRSTKLIHGGVRYLRQGRIGMVRQSLRERERLLQNAPHVVHSLDFVIPSYRWGSRTFYYAGLRAYDLLAGQLISGRARRLSSSDTCRYLPTLRNESLRGSVLYADGQFDDARLAITLARTAADHGAILVNSMPVERLLQNGSRVTGVAVRDRQTGTEILLHGRVVLNATGVFAEEILQMDATSVRNNNAEDRPQVALSQGSHLVLDASFLPGSTALMIPETDDGRVLFAIPWHGRLLLGTTDIAVNVASREPRPLESEVDYLLDHAGRYLQTRPQRSDIRSQFSGLRPLVRSGSGSQSTARLSREHFIHTSSSGLITVIGGKWTTYRQMGEDLINHAESTGGLTRKESKTAQLKLHGFVTPERRTEGPLQISAVYGSDNEGISNLVRARPELAERLDSRLPYRAAEVVWAAQKELAISVEDVLARRTRALFLDAHAAADAAPLVASLLAHENAMTESWKQQQIIAFRNLALNSYAAGHFHGMNHDSCSVNPFK